MKPVTVIVSLMLFVGVAQAQPERIPPEEAQKYAKLFVESAGKLDGPQIKMEVDTDKPYAFKAKKHGAMVLPDKKLSADVLAKAGKELVPLGQLWLVRMTLVAADQPTPADKLRLVKVTVNNEDHQMPLLLLGVRKNAKDELELVVYAKDKEPLLTVPLEKKEIQQELPLELEAKKGDNNRAQILLNILGKYQATLIVAPQE